MSNKKRSPDMDECFAIGARIARELAGYEDGARVNTLAYALMTVIGDIECPHCRHTWLAILAREFTPTLHDVPDRLQ